MQTLAEIKQLLASQGLSPRHALGQNFLIDHNMIRTLVGAADLRPGETILEIGSGTGTMTEELLARGARVVAAELDAGLCRLLRERFAGALGDGSLTLVEGDCLAGKAALAPGLLAALGGGPFRLVSNLPYGAGTPVMMILLTSVPRCGGMYVTVQREVAQRLAAPPGTEDYGVLSVIAAAVAEVRLLATLPPSCFWPQPQVHSAMVAVVRRSAPVTPRPEAFAAFVRRLFEKRRKQIGAVVGRVGPWPEGVSPTCRAESLGVEALVRLHECREPARAEP